jgi:hypothetical protein
MRYLCLIYLDDSELSTMPQAHISALNARHLEFNDALLTAGHFIEAEALEATTATTCIRVRQGKSALIDGPFAETKEQVAGFYLIEARDLNEAIRIAERIPSASMATIEVRPCRDLIVDGVKHKASRKPR